MRRDYLEDEIPARAAKFLDATPAPVFPPNVAAAVQEHPWDGQYGLYLYGDPGGGKTVAALLLARRHKCRFVTEAGLITAFRETMEPKVHERSEAGLLGWFRHYAGRIVIDDLGGGDAGALTDYSKGLVARVVDVLHQAGGTPIVTSNKAPEELAAALGARTMSRLKEMCRVVHYQHDDRRLRRREGGA